MEIKRKTLADITRTIEPAPQVAKAGFNPNTTTVRELIGAGQVELHRFPGSGGLEISSQRHVTLKPHLICLR